MRIIDATAENVEETGLLLPYEPEEFRRNRMDGRIHGLKVTATANDTDAAALMKTYGAKPSYFKQDP